MLKKIGLALTKFSPLTLFLGVLIHIPHVTATSVLPSAAELPKRPIAKSWTPFINLSGGPAWTSSHNNQTFYLTPHIENTYAGLNKTSTLGLGELFLGLQTPLKAPLLWQIGVVLGLTGNANLNGDIWEGADPDFNNFSYSYQIMHYFADVKTRLIATRCQFVQPYLSGSLGVAWNRSTNFNSVSKIIEESPALGFGKATQTSFTYTLAAGLQKTLTQHWHVNMEYEFSDWGNSMLAPPLWQTVNDGLSLNHLYTNALLVGLTYTA